MLNECAEADATYDAVAAADQTRHPTDRPRVVLFSEVLLGIPLRQTDHWLSHQHTPDQPDHRPVALELAASGEPRHPCLNRRTTRGKRRKLGRTLSDSVAVPCCNESATLASGAASCHGLASCVPPFFRGLPLLRQACRWWFELARWICGREVLALRADFC